MSVVQSPKVVGAYEAKTHLPALLDRVADGEEITITKHGTPVARLVPVKKGTTVEERRAMIAHWRESSRGLSLGGLKIRDLINQGRR
jgi:prevent-host-death family protein